MRSVVAGLFTVVAVICMIVAVPSMWVSQRVVSPEGFATSATQAARNTDVQQYFADKVAAAAAEEVRIPKAAAVVRPLAESYARSDGFVADFEEIARQQHEWLFTEPKPDTQTDVMEVNITPMVNRVIATSPVGSSFQVDQPILIAIDQHRLTAGSLQTTGTFVDRISWIAVIGAILFALLALAFCNRRSTILTWLGVGLVLAGLGGYAVAKYIQTVAGDRAVEQTDESARRIVEVVAEAVSSDLVDLSLIVGAAGGLVVVAGLILRVVSGRRSSY